MKKYLLLVLMVLLSATHVLAQGKPHVNHLRKKGRAETPFHKNTLSYYGSVYAAYMRVPLKNYRNFPWDMKNPDAIEYGINAAYLVWPWMGVGVAFSAFDNKFSSRWVMRPDAVNPMNEYFDYLNGYWGGLFVEPNVAHYYPIHVSFPIILAYGNVVEHKYRKDYINNAGFAGLVTTSEKVKGKFFMIEPGVEVEFNAYTFIRVGLGAKYRITSGVSLNNTQFWDYSYPKTLMNGVTFNLSLKFGKY